jgi:hypothetical protein
MRCAYLIIAVLTMAVSVPARAEALSDALKRLNHVDIPADQRIIDATDDGGIAAFSDYKFQCKRQDDFNPKESAKAQAQFKEFLAYYSAHSNPTDDEKSKRLALLQAAAKAGSWRADYVDLIWDIWDNRANRKALQPLGDRLADFANRGTPIAIYGYVHWMGNMPRSERYSVLKAAIDRGSPQAMVLMGHHLGMHSLALRPMAKEMLACAKSQEEPGAYDVLGQIAWREGRWVDAYRTWEEGSNKGCEDCIDHMEEFVMLNPRFQLKDGFRDSTPPLKALREYYSKQFLYQITQMTELLEAAPTDMAVHVTDEQIVALIEKRLQVFGK